MHWRNETISSCLGQKPVRRQVNRNLSQRFNTPTVWVMVCGHIPLQLQKLRCGVLQSAVVVEQGYMRISPKSMRIQLPAVCARERSYAHKTASTMRINLLVCAHPYRQPKKPCLDRT